MCLLSDGEMRGTAERGHSAAQRERERDCRHAATQQQHGCLKRQQHGRRCNEVSKLNPVQQQRGSRMADVMQCAISINVSYSFKCWYLLNATFVSLRSYLPRLIQCLVQLFYVIKHDSGKIHSFSYRCVKNKVCKEPRFGPQCNRTIAVRTSSM